MALNSKLLIVMRLVFGANNGNLLPGTAEDQALALDEMTPREMVVELDKYGMGNDPRGKID